MHFERPRYWSAAILGVISALQLGGQPTDSGELERKVRQLEERLKRMEEKLEQLQPRLGPAPAADGADGEPIAPVAVREPAEAVAGRDGFWIKSAGGDFKLNLAGYLQSDGRFYTNNLGTNTFLLRRVRPILQGTIYKNIDFRLIPDFGGGTVTLQDAYLEFKYFPKATLRAGKFKAPLGLEQLQADQDLAFVERALPTNLVPNRDLGIQLSGDLAKNRLNYAVGVFDGAPDGASADTDSNNRKDVVARLFARLKGLGVGIAASMGRQDGALPSFKTPGQVTFFSYGTNVTAAGARTRFSPQAYYYHGPLGLMFEYVRSEQRVKKGTNAPAVSNSAWQLAGSYFLTGERKAFKSGPVLREFEPFNGGWGAWELVGRFEQLTVDPAVYTLGLADPARSARRARAWAGGVNWYLNRNVKLVLNYEDTSFSGGASGGDRSREHAVLSRFQIAF